MRLSIWTYLVSALCMYKCIDETIAETEKYPDKKSAWTKEGFHEAERMIVKKDNTLVLEIIV